MSELVLKLAIGGVSGMVATLLLQPVDTFKVQIQVLSQANGIRGISKISYLQLIQQLFRERGWLCFYRGLDSALTRQLFYASTRLGLYSYLKEKYFKEQSPSFIQNMGLSMVSGAFGAFVGNPLDVILIRRQASALKGDSGGRGVVGSLRQVFREEGAAGLWKGLNATVMRVILINTGQIVSFQQFSKRQPDSTFRSALLASLVTSFLTLPVDNIKVKIQKDHPRDPLYLGYADCLRKTVAREGVLKLWVGLPVYVLRGVPHSFIIIVVQNYLQQTVKAL